MVRPNCIIRAVNWGLIELLVEMAGLGFVYYESGLNFVIVEIVLN